MPTLVAPFLPSLVPLEPSIPVRANGEAGELLDLMSSIVNILAWETLRQGKTTVETPKQTQERQAQEQAQA